MPIAAPPGVILRGQARAGDAAMTPVLDLTVAAGRWTSLLGRSGVGKSTALNAVAGVSADAVRGLHASASDGAPLSGRVAYMTQTPLTPPWMTARAAAALGPMLRGEAVDARKVDAALEACGVLALAERRPAELSGGQAQRVALARLLVEDRPIALLDEPLASLDALTRLEMIALLHVRLSGCTVLHVTHDPLEAAQLADAAIVLTATGARSLALPAGALRDWRATETTAIAARLADALADAERQAPPDPREIP